MDQGVRLRRKQSPWDTSNFLSKITFLFTLQIFIKGFKRDLEEDDLYLVPRHLKSKRIGDKLENIWIESCKLKKQMSLVAVFFKCYGKLFFTLGVAFFTFKALNSTITPRVVGKLVDYFSPDTEISKKEAYTYAALVLLFKMLEFFVLHNIFLRYRQGGLLTRTSFCSLIYRKCLRLSPAAREEFSTGKIITLITKDVDSIEFFFIFANDIWITSLEAILISVNLYNKIGVVSLVGVGMLLLVIPVKLYLTKVSDDLQTEYCKKSDIRLQETQEALSAIKIIKMYTWEFFFAERISKARRLEVRKRLWLNFVGTTMYVLSVIISQVAFYVLLMVYTSRYPMEATAENVFFIVTCFDLLKGSLTSVSPFVGVAQFLAAMRRITALLQAEELPTSHKEVNGGKPKVHFTNVALTIKEASILRNITCTFNDGLNVITGPLGCGKSTMLKMILGESQPTHGQMQVEGKVSYASQDPWLFPASIKNNIIFGEEYDEKRYKTVLHICALEYDFSILKNGDETIVEDNGMNLSKGQQVRINLARAIYRDSDIYLLDDCLAALDVTVQEHIFKHCIKEFLSNKICIWVSHSIKSIKSADQVILLSNGTIKAHFEPANKTDVQLTELLNYVVDQRENQNSDDTDEEDVEYKEEDKLLEKGIKTEGNLYREVNKIGSVDWSIYKRYFNFGGGTFVFLLIILTFIGSKLAESSWERILTNWVNLKANTTAMGQDNQTDTAEYMEIHEREQSTFLIYSVMLGVSITLVLVKNVGFYYYSSKISINIHKSMLTNVLNATMRFFDDTFIGNILNRFSRDLCFVDEKLCFTIEGCLSTTLDIVAIFGLIATVNAMYLIPSIVVCVLLLIFRWFYLPTGRSLKRLDCATRSPVVGHLNASLEGLTTIRACEKEVTLIEEFDKHQDLFTSANHMSLITERGFGFMMNVITYFYICFIVGDVLLFNVTQAGNVGLALTKAFNLTLKLQWGVRLLAQFENQLTSVERVLEYTDVKSENKSGQEIKDWPSLGALKYDGVVLKYEKTNDTVLNNLCFTIKPKEKVGIVGRTGAGKSSIISTLFRLYEIEGKILIDDVDCKTVSLGLLRSCMSIIPQDPVLFKGTIRSNIDPREEFCDEEIWRAFERVGLKGMIQDLSEPIGDGVGEFSTGQRQLFCLARALVRRNKVIVLDEATANMDPETEALITTVVEEEFAECTVLTIAHKLATVLKADRVMVLKRGQLLEFDSPQELLKDKTSRFYQMVNSDKKN